MLECFAVQYPCWSEDETRKAPREELGNAASVGERWQRLQMPESVWILAL